MRSIKKLAAILLALLLVMNITGCSALVLNEEKDAKSVVATIDGTELLKGDFTEYYQFYMFVQEAYGQSVKGTKEEMKEVKLTLFKDYILANLQKLECEAAGETVDEKTIDESVTALVDQAKKTFPEVGEYESVLKKYGYTEESILTTADEMLTLMQYNNIYTQGKVDFSHVGSQLAATVEGDELSMGMFYYYVIMEYLVSAMNGDTTANLYDTDAFYEKCYTYMVSGYKALLYAQENGLELTEEVINENYGTIDLLDAYYGLNQYAKEMFFVTDEQIAEVSELIAKCLAAQQLMFEEYADGLEITDEALKSHYELYESDYDTSTVSAYHILTEDEDFAAQLIAEAGTTKDGFMAVYEKYKEDSRVTQAMDLGSFGRGQMVAEFEDCAFSLGEGGVGNCVTSFGTHLVYVYDANLTEVSFESVKEKVLEDYRDEQINYYGQNYIDEKISDMKDKPGEYKVLPTELLSEYLYEKYNVDIDEKAAVR
ncbi:MAG: hypothetical protein E7218_03695 [Anaerofustis stercorihominis]|nr:hypothetical protein [Anaerofustis stercorihominis]